MAEDKSKHRILYSWMQWTLLESDDHVFAHNPKQRESHEATADFGEEYVDFSYMFY